MHKAKELTDTQRVKLQDEQLTATCSMDKNRYTYKDMHSRDLVVQIMCVHREFIPATCCCDVSCVSTIETYISCRYVNFILKLYPIPLKQFRYFNNIYLGN